MNTDWQTSMITGQQEQRPAVPVVRSLSSSVRRKRRSSGSMIATDAWENPVSGYGMAGVDPMASTFYQFGNFLSVQQLDSLYKNWLARRVVEELPNAALQRGFIIESEKNEKGAEEVSKLLKQWETATKTKHLGYQSRLYGGAAKINFIDDGLPTGLPVNEQMAKGLDRVIIIGRFYCRPWQFYTDPNNLKTFKKPWIYQAFEISYHMTGQNTYQVHHSRLSWMDGGYLPDHMKVRTWDSGQSIVELVEEALKDYGSSIQSLSATIQDFVVKVLQIEDMEDLLEENEEELNYRVSMANAQSNIHKTSVIGPGEDLKKISTPITGLPQSISILMDHAAAAAHMPKSQLFGHMTGTLGSSSGKYDRINWTDQVETFQTEKAQPVIEDDMRLACIIANVNFDDLVLKWPPVHEAGDKEVADIRKTNAEAESIEISNEQKRAGNPE